MRRIACKWTISLLLAAGPSAIFAQTAAEWDSPRVNGIAGKLKCGCGCKLSMSCQMPPHPCPTCKKNRIRIYNMLAAGRSEDQIIQGFVAEEGENVLWVTPGLVGRLGPYAALTFGFVVVVLVIRRYRRNANVSAGVLPDDGEPA